MFFIALAGAVSNAAAVLLRLQGRLEWRSALRVGIACAFLFTGVDHFVSTQSRYVPMMPDYFGSWRAELILLSGAMEIAAAIGLLLPLKAWRSAGLPNLRPAAGVGLAMLLSVLVVANGHMAQTGAAADGLPASQSYLVFRVFLQPIVVLWVLVASEAVFPRRA